MSANSDSTTLSLVEKKKLQWAKEKEELAALNSPWENGKTFDRNPKRRSSLPPLYKNQYNSYDKEIGGETSGYGSDNPNQSPDDIQTWHQSGYESSSSRDDRLKWGDKGVGVGKFWQPKEESTEKINIMNEPPNWVKRGLKNGEIIVNNTSPAESPEQRLDEERPLTGSSYSQNRNNFLRGQNIPIDPIELAERERRRQAALAHQEGIRQQLQDREKRRREEKERKIKEEYEEEQRIERDQELERKRKEQEFKIQQDKQDRDVKRKMAIEEAIKVAENDAKMVKNKKIDNGKNDLNNNFELSGKNVNKKEDLINTNKKEEFLTLSNNLAIILPIENLQNFHYAVLMENREKKIFRDSSTQTDEFPEKISRKERRSRSESLEERPKWGVNKPPTRYIKQSEKDPSYQKRKLRQKNRNYSSDESQIISPRFYRKKKNFSSRTEIIPLESDNDYIYYKRRNCYCCCRCGRNRCSDILKIDHNSPINNKLPDLDDKLSSLNNGLLMKQNEWQ